jgi:hypothetical protein
MEGDLDEPLEVLQQEHQAEELGRNKSPAIAPEERYATARMISMLLRPGRSKWRCCREYAMKFGITALAAMMQTITTSTAISNDAKT